MTTVTARQTPAAVPAEGRGGRSSRRALATLTRRRMLLSAHTPREIIVPLMTPVLFATVIAPALAQTAHAVNGIDYQSFVALGTVGLLVPLSCMFAGIGAIVDRQQGGQRDLLAAPAPRSFMVFGNLAVALFVSLLQLGALLVFASVRGAHFTASLSGAFWFAGASLALAVTMYAVAEIFATKLQTQEEYIGLVPAVAIVPWFLAGSLFPIRSLPAVLAAIAKVLPLTHALALMRYGLIDAHARGLHDIWGMSSTSTMAALSLLVVAVYAALLLALSVRVFGRGVVK